MGLFNMGPRRQGGEIEGVLSEANGRLRYGGHWFSAASDLPLERGLIHFGHLVSFVAAAIRRPRRVAALFALLLGTRSEDLFLSGSLAGEALRVYFDRRSVGMFPQNRFCRGVLLLPRDHSDYLRGRRRQALRTNLRRAAAAGIVCEAMSDPALALDAVSEVFHSRRASCSDREQHILRTAWASLFARPETTLMVAVDQSGRPLAVTAAVIDDMVCLIEVAVASNYEARWALHDHLVRMLIGRGVRYLLAEGGGPFGALGLTDHEQYYQHLLGYELRHLIPVPPHAMGHSRRRRASLVVAAVAAATHSSWRRVRRARGSSARRSSRSRGPRRKDYRASTGAGVRIATVVRCLLIRGSTRLCRRESADRAVSGDGPAGRSGLRSRRGHGR